MILKKQVSVQFMDSPLQGKTTLLTLDFQHQVSQALQPPIHWILSLFLQRIFEVVQKKTLLLLICHSVENLHFKRERCLRKNAQFSNCSPKTPIFLISVSNLISLHDHLANTKINVIIWKEILSCHYLEIKD